MWIATAVLACKTGCSQLPVTLAPNDSMSLSHLHGYYVHTHKLILKHTHTHTIRKIRDIFYSYLIFNNSVEQ